MKIFYKDVNDEIDAADFEMIRSGNWRAKPKRGMMFSAADARLARHYGMDGGYMTKSNFAIKLDKGTKVFFTFLIFLVFLASVWFLANSPKAVMPDQLESPVVNTYTVQDGREFICEHYSNGTMICVDQSDPDVGGGRIVP